MMDELEELLRSFRETASTPSSNARAAARDQLLAHIAGECSGAFQEAVA